MLTYSRSTASRVVVPRLLTAAHAPARPRGSLLVLCNKAPRATPSLHPRIRRMLAGDPELTRLAEENPRLLWKLEQQSGALVRSGRRQPARNLGPLPEALYLSLIGVANTYRGVAAVLRAAISQAAAGPKTMSAVFDRLRALKAHSKHGAREDLQAAFQLALEESLRRLPGADPRSLATLVRAAYYLGLPVPEEQQRRIVDKFISLVRAFQAPPAAKPRPPAAKEGWVQLKLPKRPPRGRPGSEIVPAHPGIGSGSGSNSCNTTCGGAGTSSKSSSAKQEGASVLARSARTELEHSLSNFVWATLSNSQWQLPEEQLAAMMECVRLQEISIPLHSTPILVGLVRYASTRGMAAVSPHVGEGGAAEVVLKHLLLQLDSLNPQHSSDTLMSIGILRLRFTPGTLSALFQQALEALEAAPDQQARSSVDSRQRLLDISRAFHGLGCAYDLSPGECRAALELPAARALAHEFAEGVRGDRDYAMWADMMADCGLMGFNPQVGSQEVPLLETLLTHLPANNTSGGFSYLRSLDILVFLGQLYGLPSGRRAALGLQPYRKSLARLARGCLGLFEENSGRDSFKLWCAARRQTPASILQILDAYNILE